MRKLRNYKLGNYKSSVSFRRALLRWYDQNRRDLPWRNTRDPYRIWISEVMLQQTRVAAVIPFYERFLDCFPDVGALASAPEPAVLAAWSGLGYYRRARNLHAAAREIAARGAFPEAIAEIGELPGIGRYTAAAIASIAFGQPCAVVDGNVERVLTRISAKPLSKERAWSTAQQLISKNRPGDFNQAMMELGATLCFPKVPRCAECPVQRFCGTRGEHVVGKPQRRLRQAITCLLTTRRDQVFLTRRRKTESIMPGMWELPSLPLCDETSPSGGESFRVRHSIMNTDYEVLVCRSSTRTLTSARAEISAEKQGSNLVGAWVRRSRLPQLPLTGLTRKVLRRSGLMP